MKRLDKFLVSEIGIEFKSALYFYSMLFFYMGYSLVTGSRQLEISTVLQMVAATYIMGFVQVYLLGNFDEAERIGWREVLSAMGCSVVYSTAGWMLNWFDRSLVITVVFFFFVLASYGCACWMYSYRRTVTTRQLNHELEAFKNTKNNAEEEKNDSVY